MTCVNCQKDIAVGSRFIGRKGYRSSRSRRQAIRILAWTVTLLVGGRVTDPTSGFQVTNRRAIALSRAARAVVADHGGRIPSDPAVLQRLPGIGPYTAAAVAALGSIGYMLS